MRITINKEYTEKELEAGVKADIEEFKKHYNDSDIKLAIATALDTWTNNFEILKVTLEAMPAGNWYDNVTIINVSAVIDRYCEIIRINFYVDTEMTIWSDHIVKHVYKLA